MASSGLVWSTRVYGAGFGFHQHSHFSAKAITEMPNVCASVFLIWRSLRSLIWGVKLFVCSAVPGSDPFGWSLLAWSRLSLSRSPACYVWRTSSCHGFFLFFLWALALASRQHGAHDRASRDRAHCPFCEGSTNGFSLE